MVMSRGLHAIRFILFNLKNSISREDTTNYEIVIIIIKTNNLIIIFII